jgi:hypothetical protein
MSEYFGFTIVVLLFTFPTTVRSKNAMIYIGSFEEKSGAYTIITRTGNLRRIVHTF